jgi:peptide-methionine (R)-S-oxide reductase
MTVVKTNLWKIMAILIGTLLVAILVMRSGISNPGNIFSRQSDNDMKLTNAEDKVQLAGLEHPIELLPESTQSTKKKEKVMLTWKDILRFAEKGNPQPDSVVTKTDTEWKKLLTPEQYNITRQKGTERAYSSEMCSLFEPGLYACVCCGTRLFDSGEKFESGTGWPSFTQPIKENVIAYHLDNSFGMQRVETICNTCGAHLGHVFPDGPEPGGLRYCINALALKKIKK